MADPHVNAAKAHHRGNQDAGAKACLGANAQAHKRQPRYHAHQHQQLRRAKGDGAFLRLICQNRIKRHAAGLHVLLHFLAQRFHHLFAARALFQHFKPAVDAVVQADRAAKNGQVYPFDQDQHADKDKGINQGFSADIHGRYSGFAGS